MLEAMITTRRGLLGMFAAGAAAAIVPAGILMPVRRRIWTPAEIVAAHFVAANRRYIAAMPDTLIEWHFLGVDYGRAVSDARVWYEEHPDGRPTLYERAIELHRRTS